MNKKPRAKYNFLMKLPSKVRFTVQDAMAKNPGVLYITIYMRLKKMVKANELRLNSETKHDGKTRGASQKLYERVPAVVEIKKPTPELVTA
jgi:hypothetical protein